MNDHEDPKYIPKQEWIESHLYSGLWIRSTSLLLPPTPKLCCVYVGTGWFSWGNSPT